jgi:hypothetical protein
MSIDWSASSRLALARKSAQIISRQYPPDLSYTACLIQLEVDDPHSFESRPVSSFSTSRLNLILWQGMRFVQPGSTIEVLPMPPGYFRQSKPFVQPTSFRLNLRRQMLVDGHLVVSLAPRSKIHRRTSVFPLSSTVRVAPHKDTAELDKAALADSSYLSSSSQPRPSAPGRTSADSVKSGLPGQSPI